MRIHIFGASGSGTTTLVSLLAYKLACAQFDTDDFYWQNKYTQAFSREERIQRLRPLLEGEQHWVLSGSLCGWGDPLIPLFELVVFLYLAPEIRVQRLQKRELERYGAEINEGGSQHASYLAFMDWASQYDTGDETIRSLSLHENWLSTLPCPVLRLSSLASVHELAESVCQKIASLGA